MARNNLKTTSVSMDILETIRVRGGARISELAEILDMPPSTVHSHVATFYDEGYLIKEEDNYVLGVKWLALAEAAKTRNRAYSNARFKVRKLANETGLRSHFIIEENGRGYYLYSFSIDKESKIFATVGMHAPLHATAGGKAILSELSEQRVAEIIGDELNPETKNTVTSPNELEATLERIRERGYAYNREEHLHGVYAVGTAVCDGDEQVVGALSVAGPAHRLKGKPIEEEIPQTLLGIANELELDIVY